MNFREQENSLESYLPPQLFSIVKKNLKLWNQESDQQVWQELLSQWTTEIRQKLLVHKNKNSTSPKVSVIIPAKNEEGLILQTLDSLSEQVTNFNFEVIVVANNCSDRTVFLSELTGATVVVYQQTAQSGPIAFARQKGLEIASGDIIISADADILAPNTWLEELATVLTENSHIACVTGGLNHWSLSSKKYHVMDFSLDLFRRALAARKSYSIAVGANMGFRKNDASTVGGYDVNIHPGEDVNLSKKLNVLGEIKLVTGKKVTVWASARRIEGSGGVLKTIFDRRKQGGGYTNGDETRDYR